MCEITVLCSNALLVTADVTSTDWSLQHGHCLALGAALKEAGDKLISEQYADATMDAILKHHTSDRVRVVH